MVAEPRTKWWKGTRMSAGTLCGVAVVLCIMAAILGADSSTARPSHRSPLDASDVGRSTPAASCTTTHRPVDGAGACSPDTHRWVPGTCSERASTCTAPVPAAAPDPATTTLPPTSTTSTARTAPATAPPPAPTSVGAAAHADSGPCGGAPAPIASPSGSWSCTFDDEFNATSLDTTHWQPQLTSTSGYSTGMGSRVCYVDSPDTITEADGYLNLSVVRSPSTYCHGLGGMGAFTQYEGGMVSSYQLFSQKYGFFETRAAMPPVSGAGLQESLWLYPENEKLYGSWPDSGEIDYAEFYSDLPDADVPVTHYPGSSSDPNANIGACTVPGATTAGQFNTYGLSWTPTTITAYFNGVACMTDTYGPYVARPDVAPQPFDQPFFLAFTSALGVGNNKFEPATTPLPSTTRIDWVRVWQSS